MYRRRITTVLRAGVVTTFGKGTSGTRASTVATAAMSGFGRHTEKVSRTALAVVVPVIRACHMLPGGGFRARIRLTCSGGRVRIRLGHRLTGRLRTRNSRLRRLISRVAGRIVDDGFRWSTVGEELLTLNTTLYFYTRNCTRTRS